MLRSKLPSTHPLGCAYLGPPPSGISCLIQNHNSLCLNLTLPVSWLCLCPKDGLIYVGAPCTWHFFFFFLFTLGRDGSWLLHAIIFEQKRGDKQNCEPSAQILSLFPPSYPSPLIMQTSSKYISGVAILFNLAAFNNIDFSHNKD